VPIALLSGRLASIWLLGFGGFPNTDLVRQTADAFGLDGAPAWVVIALFVGVCRLVRARRALWITEAPSPADLQA
jgi:hypothetical protein